MYVKCGYFEEALSVFDCLQNRDVVAWNTLITWYLEHGTSKGSVFCFDQMKMMGISQNAVTFLCMLRFGKAKQVLEGLRIHKVVSWNALMFGYTIHKQGHEALDCLERMQNECVFPNAITFFLHFEGFWQHERD